MKHIVKLSLLALITAFLPSCETYVQGHGHARSNSRRPAPQHHHHQHSSGTNVNANIGASLGL